MHLSTRKMPENFWLDWHCPSISFFISKPILYQPEKMLPSGLRFWLAVDHRTNDSSSVCGVCEAYYISTRCEPLYPKCNCISSNKSMNMTPSSPIPRRQRHFVDCQRTRMTQMTKDFAMRHDENYVEWNGISIKWYQFVTNCPYHQTIRRWRQNVSPIYHYIWHCLCGT